MNFDETIEDLIKTLKKHNITEIEKTKVDDIISIAKLVRFTVENNIEWPQEKCKLRVVK